MSTGENQPHGHTATGVPPAPAGEIVGQITGDRWCARCGFSLHGQTVVREPHYRMPAARCPECGTMAALEEYPALGRWAGRWAGVLAVAWLGVALGLLAATLSLNTISASTAVYDASAPAAIFLVRSQNEWVAQQIVLNQEKPGTGKPYNASFVNQPHTEYGYIDLGFVNDVGVAKLRESFARSGEPRFDVSRITWWVFVAMGMGLLGVAWSGVLLGLTRRRLVVIVPIVGALSLAIMLMTWAAHERLLLRTGGGSSAYELGPELTGWGVAWALAVLGLVPLGLGAMLGRPLLRWSLRALLPPSARGALSILWHCDGLRPPRLGP
jgi:hypothetical protein